MLCSWFWIKKWRFFLSGSWPSKNSLRTKYVTILLQNILLPTLNCLNGKSIPFLFSYIQSQLINFKRYLLKMFGRLLSMINLDWEWFGNIDEQTLFMVGGRSTSGLFTPKSIDLVNMVNQSVDFPWKITLIIHFSVPPKSFWPSSFITLSLVKTKPFIYGSQVNYFQLTPLIGGHPLDRRSWWTSNSLHTSKFSDYF